MSAQAPPERGTIIPFPTRNTQDTLLGLLPPIVADAVADVLKNIRGTPREAEKTAAIRDVVRAMHQTQRR